MLRDWGKCEVLAAMSCNRRPMDPSDTSRSFRKDIAIWVLEDGYSVREALQQVRHPSWNVVMSEYGQKAALLDRCMRSQ